MEQNRIKPTAQPPQAYSEQEYNRRKAKLRNRPLTPLQYEKGIRKIAKDLKL